jgi:RimJ/RimL family protein N-acetyltransferase
MILRRFISPKGAEIIIRNTTEDDALALLEHTRLTLRAFPEFVLTEPEEFTKNEEEEKAWIRQHNEGPAAFLAVAESNKKIIGIIHIEAGKRNKLRHSGEFAIAVHPDFTEQKVGSALLECMIDWARSNEHMEKIILNVNENNHRAVRLYEKFGFVIEGRNLKALKMTDGRHLNNLQMALFVK